MKNFTYFFVMLLFVGQTVLAQTSFRSWVVTNQGGENTQGQYGTKGVGSTENTPGGRFGAASCRDQQGTLWLFGGGANGKLHNDLWSFNIVNYEWAWVSGSNEVDQSGVFGQKGISSAQNMIGSKLGASMWADNEGNLWVFGGLGYINGISVVGNDLWKYNIQSKQWTWVGGSNDSFVTTKRPVYGTMGTPDPNNTPGARYFMLNFKDKAGNLWLFGGNNGNDLWRYSIVTGTWTWMKGNSTPATPGQYGQLNVENAANLPDSRSRPTGTLDNEGNFWLFGGRYFDDDDENYYLNDVWKFSPSSNNWTWVGGTKTLNDPGNYGTKKTPSTTNLPPGREGAAAWVDNNGILWLFGGQRLSGNLLNDTWQYIPATKEWVWVEGSNGVNQPGACHRTPEPDNTPGARADACVWEDALGSLWLFGGRGYPCSGISPTPPTFQRSLNDMNKVWVPPVDLKLDITSENVESSFNKQQLVTLTLSELSKFGATRIRIRNPLPKGLKYDKRKTDLYQVGNVTVSNDTVYWYIDLVLPQTSTSLQYYTRIDTLNRPTADLASCATLYYQYAFDSNEQNNTACSAVSIITSLENTGAYSVLLYPNPSSDYLTIQSVNTQPLHWEVKDLSGRTVLGMPASTTTERSFTIRSLPAGVYFVEVVQGSKLLTFKVLKE